MEPPIFGLDDEPALNDLREALLEHRAAACLHVEFWRWSGVAGVSAKTVLDTFLKGLGMRTPEQWTKVDASGALAVVTRALHLDQAYETPAMTFELAQKLAHRFIECFEDQAIFLTGFSLTDATFEDGIVGISSNLVGLLWVDDED